jgi:acetylornithine/succinyldiaminopimelate/putrescine aminotransferase
MLGHLTTFGGHPVSCAAGWAAFHVLQREGWIEEVAAKESLLRRELSHLSVTGSLSGQGLLLALPLGDFDRVLAVQQELIQQGLLTDWFLFENQALRLAPPLSISEDELLQACRAIRQAIPSHL